MRLLRYLGLWLHVLITCSPATSIGERPNDLQLGITTSNTHLRNIAASDTTARIRRRAFDRVPGLPAGWKAIYDVITNLRGIPRPSQRRILQFYDMILDAAYQNTLGPDTVRKTFHLGNLALQFQSRQRDQQNVTRELVIATIGIAAAMKTSLAIERSEAADLSQVFSCISPKLAL